MYRIRKMFDFEAAHILSKAFSQDCESTIHGHSYKVEVFLVGYRLADNGMLFDFGRLKGLFEKYDHALFIPRDKTSIIDPSMNSKLILCDQNPTAEWMACSFYSQVSNWLSSYPGFEGAGVTLEKIRVHETETGWAEYGEQTL